MTALALPRPGATLLTDADRDLIAMLADGLSAAEIGRRIYLSERTTQRRVLDLVAKTATSSRLNLVATALRCGWLDRAERSVAA